MSERLYSVRMRASLGDIHISGAERIVSAGIIGQTASEMAERAISHERGEPDSIIISVDSLSGRDIRRLAPLPVTAIDARSVDDARGRAVSELVSAGVSMTAALKALDALTIGASVSGGNMRGAMIIDASTGARLEPDGTRGVRARAVDYDDSCLPLLTQTLSSHGLDRTHLKEALALATKVANAPAAVAELCVSDDPSYVTGYVASPGRGYVRITPVKRQGDPMGGRAFFVDGTRFDLDEYISYMRETPVLISGPVEFA